MNCKNKVEILSPAGNLETLKIAVANGADAVYIGGKNFSARKNAVNFTDDEILQGVKFAHLYGAKVYVTLNILIHDSELEDAFEFIKFLYCCGVDALIVQDLGIVYMIRKYFPDFHIHASTQMTVHSLAGARKAKELGFSRVVLSREISFDEIKNIHDNTDIELEVFVHGALCMSYSGQCLMSSFLGCRSGNRGECAQPCRLPYSLSDAKGNKICSNKYPLSLKDLCLIDEIKKLSDIGVASLKIEGRMKSAQYVAAVTSIYNKYRDGKAVSKEDMSILENIFSRSGFTKGYLYRDTGRDMLNYDKNNDNIYKDINKDVLKYADELKKVQPPKIKADASVVISEGKPAFAEFYACGVKAEVNGKVNAVTAVNAPLSEERVRSQILKSGNTPFEISSINVSVDGNVSLPIKELNGIRREGLCLLEEKISDSTRNSTAVYAPEKRVDENTKNVLYKAEVRTFNQAKSAISAGFNKVLVPYELYIKERSRFSDFKSRVAVVLPNIERDGTNVTEPLDADEIYVSNISQFGRFNARNIVANYTLNTFNSFSLRTLKELGAQGVCLSPELNIRQISKIDGLLEKELIAYGRIPLMTVQNCVVKSTMKKCGCKSEAYYLTDRRGVRFPLYTNRLQCTNTIYNSLPVYMADKMDEMPLGGVSALRFIFTDETDEQIKDIMMRYTKKEKCTWDFTRGHYFRGV